MQRLADAGHHEHVVVHRKPEQHRGEREQRDPVDQCPRRPETEQRTLGPRVLEGQHQGTRRPRRPTSRFTGRRGHRDHPPSGGSSPSRSASSGRAAETGSPKADRVGHVGVGVHARGGVRAGQAKPRLPSTPAGGASRISVGAQGEAELPGGTSPARRRTAAFNVRTWTGWRRPWTPASGYGTGRTRAGRSNRRHQQPRDACSTSADGAAGALTTIR